MASDDQPAYAVGPVAYRGGAAAYGPQQAGDFTARLSRRPNDPNADPRMIAPATEPNDRAIIMNVGGLKPLGV